MRGAPKFGDQSGLNAENKEILKCQKAKTDEMIAWKMKIRAVMQRMLPMVLTTAIVRRERMKLMSTKGRKSRSIHSTAVGWMGAEGKRSSTN